MNAASHNLTPFQPSANLLIRSKTVQISPAPSVFEQFPLHCNLNRHNSSASLVGSGKVAAMKAYLRTDEGVFRDLRVCLRATDTFATHKEHKLTAWALPRYT